MIESVIFDFYGTLVDIRTDEENDHVWHKLSLYFSYFVGKLDSSDLKNTYQKLVRKFLPSSPVTDYPEIDLMDVFKELFSIYGYVPSRQEVLDIAKVFRMLSTEYIRLYPHTLEILEWLKEKNINLYILSNAQRCFMIPELKKLGIAEYFKGIYISSDFKKAKPDTNFLNILLDREHISIPSSIFVGNDPTTDIEIANKINMKSIYLHTNCSPPLSSPIKTDHIIQPACLLRVKKILTELI